MLHFVDTEFYAAAHPHLEIGVVSDKTKDQDQPLEMTANKEIDIDALQQHFEAKLAFLADVKVNKKSVEDARASYVKNGGDIGKLNSTLLRLLEERCHLRGKHNSEVDDRTAKKKLYKDKQKRYDRILLQEGDSSSGEDGIENAGGENCLDKLKVDISKLASDLLSHRRELGKKLAALNSKDAEINVTENAIAMHKGLLASLASNTKSLAEAIDNVMSQTHSEQESIAAKQDIADKIIQIEALQTSKSALSAPLVQSYVDCKSLRENVASKGQVIAEQVQVPVITGSNMQDTYEQGRQSMYWEIGALARAGMYVRDRKLEWHSSGKQNQELIDLGHKASHYGMVLADAALYQSTSMSIRTDTLQYKSLYGVNPDFVWANQDCSELMDVLDWRAAMKDFYGHSYTNTTLEGTKFYTLLNGHLRSLDIQPLSSSLSCKIKLTFHSSSALYIGLKKEHDAALEKHNKYLKNR